MNNEKEEIVLDIILNNFKNFFEKLKKENEDKQEKIEEFEKKFFNFLESPRDSSEFNIVDILTKTYEMFSELEMIVGKLDNKIMEMLYKIIMELKRNLKR